MSAAERKDPLPARKNRAGSGVSEKRKSRGQPEGNSSAAIEAIAEAEAAFAPRSRVDKSKPAWLYQTLLAGRTLEFERAVVRLAWQREIEKDVHPLTPQENRQDWLEVAEAIREGEEITPRQRARLAEAIEMSVSQEKAVRDQAFLTGSKYVKPRAWRQRIALQIDALFKGLEEWFEQEASRTLRHLPRGDVSEAGRLEDRIEQRRRDLKGDLKSMRSRLALRVRISELTNPRAIRALRRDRSAGTAGGRKK